MTQSSDASSVNDRSAYLELEAAVCSGDRSPTIRCQLVDALESDASWYEDNPYNDGLSRPGWTVHLWQLAERLIRANDDAATREEIRGRISAGSSALLFRSAELGPELVADAQRLHLDESQSRAMRKAASHVLRRNTRKLDPASAVAHYLQELDRLEEHETTADLLVAIWSRLAEPELRAVVHQRWSDGSLQAWCAARLHNTPNRRYLIGILTAAPDDAVPLLVQACADVPPLTALWPVLAVDSTRVPGLLDANPNLRDWAMRSASQIARGERFGGEPPFNETASALLAVVGNDSLFDTMLATIARTETDHIPHAWDALAALVRRDMTRFSRAANAAIQRQLRIVGIGYPEPAHGLRTIAALDSRGMVVHVIASLDAIKSSPNAARFIDLMRDLRDPAARPHLQQWHDQATDYGTCYNLARAIEVLDAEPAQRQRQ